MIACIELPDRNCVIHWVGRRGLKVKAMTYCGAEHDVGSNGVLQFPDSLLTGRQFANLAGTKLLPLCPICKIKAV